MWAGSDNPIPVSENYERPSFNRAAFFYAVLPCAALRPFELKQCQ